MSGRSEHETTDSSGTKHKGTLIHDDQRSSSGWEQRADGKWYKVDYYKLHEERQWVEIITKLFIGFGFQVARNEDFIREKNITRILVLGTEPEAEQLTRLSLTVRHFPTDENTIEQYFEQAVALLKEAANEQQSVLVVCRDGLALSPLIIIAYLVAIHRWTLQSAVERVTQRLKISLAEWAMTVLVQWEKFVLKQSVVIEKIVQPPKQEIVVQEEVVVPPPPPPIVVPAPQPVVVVQPQPVFELPPVQISYIVHEPTIELPPARWYYSTPQVPPPTTYYTHQQVQTQPAQQYYTEYVQPQQYEYVQQQVVVPQQQQYVQQQYVVDYEAQFREQEATRLRQEQQLQMQQQQLILQQQQQQQQQQQYQLQLQQQQQEQLRLQQEAELRQKRITQQQTSGVEVTRVTTTTQSQAFIGNASWHSGNVRVTPARPNTASGDSRLPPPF